jgi:poly(3-hydroxybutyrate) depolymerase
MRISAWAVLAAAGLWLMVGTACEDSGAATSGSGAAGATTSTGGSDGGATTSDGGDGGGGSGAEGGGGSMVDPSASPGCVDGAGIPDGESTFMLNGEARRYIVYLPTGYTQQQTWPVVLALHPNGGNIDYWNNTDGPRNIRGLVEDSAVLVLAEDITNNWPDDLDTELSYFDTIVTRLKNELCIDQDEIFSMGFSGGGSFSGVLGCRRPDIRAIASGGAIIYFDEADCVNAPAAWVTIGQGELVPARAEFRDFWRDGAMCDATTMPTEPSPCVAYDGCDAGKPVHYCEHGGDHVWPDFGTQAAWDFFQLFID